MLESKLKRKSTHRAQPFVNFTLPITALLERPVLTATRHCMNNGQLVAACSMAMHVPKSCTTKYLQEVVERSDNTKPNALQRHNQSHKVLQQISVAAEEVNDAEASKRQIGGKEFDVENCQDHWC